jgi:phosphatidylglycerophosphate synthase
LSVLQRQLLSLQDAGIEVVEVDGLASIDLPPDPRLTMRILPAQEPSAAPALRARTGLVWHRLLPKRLAAEGYTGDIEAAPLKPDEFVIAATDAASRERAEDLLLQSLLKATDGIVSRSINRPISLRVTRALLESSLTPNQMTLIAAVFGLAAVCVVLVGGMAWLVPGAILLQIQSILDGCDGEISRLKYIRSRLGEWLDQVLDDVVNLGFFAATGWALHQAGSTLALPLTIVGSSMHLIYQTALYTALVTRGGGSGSTASIHWKGLTKHSPIVSEPTRGFLTTVKETFELACRRDFFTFLYLPSAILGVPEVALAWTGMIFFLSGLGTGLHYLLLGAPEPARSR